MLCRIPVFLCAFLAFCLTAPVDGVVRAAETPSASWLEMAALTSGGGEAEADESLPVILSDDDADRYAEILIVQETGDWKAADVLIGKLENRILMGHVLAQRYLHPTKYRSKYTELRDWMDAYADHPQARQIHALALRRQPKGARALTGPTTPTAWNGEMFQAPSHKTSIHPPSRHASPQQRRAAARLSNKIRYLVGHGWTLAGKRLIQSAEARRTLDPFEYDQACARLAFRYFVDGQNEWALEWAAEAAKRSGKYLPEAHWAAGLAAWRLGRLEVAARAFEAVAESANSSPWIVSAGAFWAARARLVNRQPAEVNRLLEMAAAQSRTFYGLLAARILGIDPVFDWTPPPVDAQAVERVFGMPAGQRAMALMEVGDEILAERELRGLVSRDDPALARGVLVLASRARMPFLAVRLNESLYPDGGGFDGAAFPLPVWEPESGFRVDRALVFALMRQESRFNPNAKSHAGASGVMQLMPGTASFVAQDRSLRRAKRHRLFTPEYNMELGQTYIEMLLRDAKIDGDLFKLLAAWNGGPGNLNKWRRQTEHREDPLLFIEGIPARETRIFLERVLANMWIYRDRFGQNSPSLDALAAGAWPGYTPLDSEPKSVASHVEDRR